MGEEVERSSSWIADQDLKAVAVYLKDQGAPENAQAQAVAASDPVMKAGQAIYRDLCSACHQLDGSGVAEMFPALRDAPAVRAADPTSLIRAVVNGAKSASTEEAPTGPGMPSLCLAIVRRADRCRLDLCPQCMGGMLRTRFRRATLNLQGRRSQRGRIQAGVSIYEQLKLGSFRKNGLSKSI